MTAAWIPRPRNADEPACWSWPVPPLRDPYQEAALIIEAQRHLPRDRQFKESALVPLPGQRVEDEMASARWTEFHIGARASARVGREVDGRCAICACSGALVQDHCHETGQVRGMLCRSCNVIEGRRGSDWPPVVRYRRVHPAAILDYHDPYDGHGWCLGWSFAEHPREAARAYNKGIARPALPWPAIEEHPEGER